LIAYNKITGNGKQHICDSRGGPHGLDSRGT